jgi:putative membrane protein
MSTEATTTITRRTRWMRRAAIAAVVLVPLAFAGLFIAAIGQTTTPTSTIPVAIVNQDSLQKVTQADGSVQNVFAGRQLVTDLTGTTGFAWTITNEADANAALKSGKVYAILTVPSNFSTSILSLSSTSPSKANLSIRTDDAHSYLTGSVAQVVGQTMSDTFGKAITAQYIGGLYSSIGGLGTALTQAADGAGKLSTGASSLSTGLATYADGVGSLSNGLSQLNDGASGLSDLSAGVTSYANSIAQLNGLMSSVDLSTVTDAATKGKLQALAGGLSQAAAGGQTLASKASSGISGVQYGISQSSSGAAQLSSNSSSLTSGAESLASGANSLATGLQSGAAKLPTTDAAAAKNAANVASDPLALSVTTDNKVTHVGQLVATFFVPLGLWIGALAVFLVLRPASRRALTSTASNGRLVVSAVGRASVITAAQALLLVALLHTTTGVSWALLPATLGFAVLMALAFTAFHYLLTVALGRAGLVVSLLALAIQVTSTGGIYPIQLLATPFQVISPLMPLTYAVNGMQGIITGGDPGGVVASALILLGFGVVSMLLALVAVRRSRRARAIGLVPSTL